MIKVNLLKKKKVKEDVKVFGLSITDVRPIPIVLVILINYIADIAIGSYFSDKEENIKTQMAAKDKVLKEIRKFNNKPENLKLAEEVEKIKQQTEELSLRSKQVDDLLKIRKNPSSLLESIAKSMPEDMWLEELEISKKDEFLATGGAKTFESIRSFEQKLSQTKFFPNGLPLDNNETKTFKTRGREARYEEFIFKGEVDI